MPASRTKATPAFSERMTLGSAAEVFTTEAPAATWESTHHRRTFWLSDELAAAIKEQAAAAGRSGSAEVEHLLRTAYGMAPDA